MANAKGLSGKYKSGDSLKMLSPENKDDEYGEISREGVSKFDLLEEQLMRLLPTLPPKLRSAATFLLENPGEIATQSLRRVSARSGVALPNFARLAQALGFSTYNELRDAYRERVQAGAIGGYPERANRLQSSGKSSGDDAVWASFREAALANVKAVFSQVDASRIAGVADKLLERQRIHIAGMQASHPFCAYLGYVGGMVAPKFRVLGQGVGSVADDLVDLGEQDAVICVALQPCARATVQVARSAYDRGIYVVGITDSPASPLAAYSSDVLLTSCGSPLFFESYVGTIAVIELLLGFVTLRSGSDTVGRIAEIEAERHRFGEYWVSGGTGRQS